MAHQFISVQSLSCVSLCNPMDCSTPGFPIHHCSWSSLKLMSIESVMPSTISFSVIPFSSCLQSFPASGSLQMSQYWSVSFNISPCNEYSGPISFRMDWLDLLASQVLSRIFSDTTVQKHQFFGA